MVRIFSKATDHTKKATLNGTLVRRALFQRLSIHIHENLITKHVLCGLPSNTGEVF